MTPARSSSLSFLPDPSGDGGVAAANEEVLAATKGKRKRGQYHHYDATLQLKIAKYACENGNKSTVEKFSKELCYELSEGTVRNFKRTYLSKLKALGDADAITSLHHATLGRSLLVGEFDDQVAAYIRQLREAGGVVNCNIVIAAAKGIISHKNPSLLKEYAGHLDLGKQWAQSFLHCRNFVKRKATKAARNLPVDFPKLKLAFLRRIQDEVVSQHTF